jgi:outer membrane protein assembly factor BamA
VTEVAWTPPSVHSAFGEISSAPGVSGDAFSAAPSIPDSSSFSFRDYRLRFSPDFVAADGLFASNIGVAAQTAIGFSDVLGNHQFVIGAAIYGSILDADVFLSYANLTSRTNWGVSLFQYRSDFVVIRNDGEDEDFLSQVNRGLEVGLSRPFNRFRRLELGVEFVGIQEREFSTGFASTFGPTSYIDIPGESGNRLFVRPRVALVSDNVVYGSTGPISGGRSRFEVEHAVGGVHFTTLFADHRTYLNTRQAYVFAFRGIAASSFGRNPQTFRIGGSYTLRGYDFGEIRGENLLLANAEFRFPLIDVVKFGWPLPIAFTGIRGLLFFDTGVAWDDARAFKPIGGQADRKGFYLNDVKAAYGFGARMNAFGFLIARWDIARKTDLKDNLSPWVGRFSLGAEF